MRRTARDILFITVVLLSLASTAAQSKVIYVDDDAPPPGDGTSWVTAYRFLQDALTDAQAAEKPVEIRVAQGLYAPDRSSANLERTRDTDVVFKVVYGMSLFGRHTR